MRDLNPSGPTRSRTFSLATADVKTFVLYGLSVLFDSNSLAAAVLDEGESAPPNWGQKAKPQVAPNTTCHVGKIVLNVTHACNLACRYCFAAEYESLPTMSPQIAQAAIAKLFDTKTDINVSFFGGEPLLAWDTVRAAIAKARQLAEARRVRANFHITTNACLLDDAKIAELKKYGVSLLISMDGPAEIHNAWRPAKGANVDSHAMTLDAIHRLKAAGYPKRPNIRATFSLAEPRLLERLKYFAQMQDDGLIGGYSVEPAILSEGCGKDTGEPPVDWRGIEAEYHAAAEWQVERIKAGKPIGFYHFRKLLARLRSRQASLTECGAGKGYVSVAPDGTICACHRETGTQIGRLDIGIDEDARAPWLENRLHGRAECRACWARHVCGGGCRQILAERGLPLTGIYPPRCAIMQIIIRECLWILTQLPQMERPARSF